MRIGGQRPGGVENACRFFASRDGGQHRPEEPDAIDVDGRSAEIRADGSSLPSGVYAVRAVGETFADVRTLTLTQ